MAGGYRSPYTPYVDPNVADPQAAPFQRTQSVDGNSAFQQAAPNAQDASLSRFLERAIDSGDQGAVDRTLAAIKLFKTPDGAVRDEMKMALGKYQGAQNQVADSYLKGADTARSKGLDPYSTRGANAALDATSIDFGGEMPLSGRLAQRNNEMAAINAHRDEVTLRNRQMHPGSMFSPGTVNGENVLAPGPGMASSQQSALANAVLGGKIDGQAFDPMNPTMEGLQTGVDSANRKQQEAAMAQTQARYGEKLTAAQQIMVAEMKANGDEAGGVGDANRAIRTYNNTMRGVQKAQAEWDEAARYVNDPAYQKGTGYEMLSIGNKNVTLQQLRSKVNDPRPEFMSEGEFIQQMAGFGSSDAAAYMRLRSGQTPGGGGTDGGTINPAAAPGDGVFGPTRGDRIESAMEPAAKRPSQPLFPGDKPTTQPAKSQPTGQKDMNKNREIANVLAAGPSHPRYELAVKQKAKLIAAKAW